MEISRHSSKLSRTATYLNHVYFVKALIVQMKSINMNSTSAFQNVIVASHGIIDAYGL